MDQRMIEKTKVILNRMKVKLASTDGEIQQMQNLDGNLQCEMSLKTIPKIVQSPVL